MINQYTFEQSGYKIRLLDLQPKAKAIQANVYNPNDAGHSMAFFLQYEQELTGNLEEVKNSIPVEMLDEWIAKAKANFEST